MNNARVSRPSLPKIGAGFTLIEILVVVSIAAFLAAIISVALNNSRTRSLDTRRVNDIFTIQRGINLYFTDQRVYPPGTDRELGDSSNLCLSESGFSAACPGGETVYMARVPANQGPGGVPYTYNQTAGGNNYSLEFELESDTGSISAGFHTLTATGIQ